MKTKKLVCLFLALVLSTTALFSCGGDTVETTADTTPADTTPVETETEDPWLDDLPEGMDFGGRTVTILSRVETEKNEFVVEELTGDVINDAIFNRNLGLESRLKVKIANTEITGDDGAGIRELENAVTAGSTDYDIFCSNSYSTAKAAYNGHLLNLADMKYVDLSKEYWSQGLNEAASIGGKQFIASGPMSLGFYRYMMVSMFNKDLFLDAGIDFPYQMVLDGKWTLDYQNQLSETFYVDLNGNGEKDAADRFGYVTRMKNDTSINDGYWGSLGLRTVTKDENGYYVYDVDVETFVNGIDALLRLMNGGGTAQMCANDDDIYKRFNEGLSAMTVARLHVVEEGRFREMEYEYGILPMPKASEAQPTYYSYDQDQFLVYGIPKSVPVEEVDNMGMFLEAYASESYNTIKPAYYETALTVKYVNDAESAAMLDMIVEGMTIDPSNLYLGMITFNAPSLLRSILMNNNNTAASMIASSRTSVETNIEKINEAYRSME